MKKMFQREQGDFEMGFFYRFVLYPPLAQFSCCDIGMIAVSAAEHRVERRKKSCEDIFFLTFSFTMDKDIKSLIGKYL
jgi:hypothetical protein